MARERSCMDPVEVGSRDGMGHRMGHGVVVDSRRLVRGHVVESVHSDGRRNNRGVVGYDHGTRVENIRVVVGHGGHSHPSGMGHDALVNGNEHGRVECLVGSLWSISAWPGDCSWSNLHRQRR